MRIQYVIIATLLLSLFLYLVTKDKKSVVSRLVRPANVEALTPAPSPGSLTLTEIFDARTEMKNSLLALYTAQRIFHAEHGRYSTDILSALGYEVRPTPRWSNVGFSRPYLATSLAGGEDPKKMTTKLIAANLRPSAEVALEDLAQHCRAGCTASDSGFEIIAGAILVPGQAPDVWTINEQNVLTHAHDGTQSIR